MRIDAHQHFWQLSREQNDWIDDSLWQLRRDYRPEHLSPYLDLLSIEKTVLVEASAGDDENRFMADEAASTDFVGAIVGWIDLWAGDAPNHIATLAAREKFRGLRPAIDQSPTTPPTLNRAFIAGGELMAQHGLSFDAMAVPHLIPFFTELADACPDLPIVLDHCGKPDIGNGRDAGDGWRRDVAAFAARPNTWCKLSGISREWGAGWHADGLRSVYDHVLDRFGADRVMWGSDWPVLEMTASYSQWFGAVCQMLDGCSAIERSAVLGGSAAEFYKI